MVVDLPSLIYLMLAVALGSIVGLENEYRMQSGTKIYLGLRTCIFISLLGYIFALLYIISGSSPALLIAGAAVITIIATSIYLAKSNLIRNPGATTFIATFMVFTSGLLVGLGYYEYAIVLSVLAAAISFYKREFLEVILKIKRNELLAIINILLVAFVILPLLPDTYIGPYSFFNPFEFWLIVATMGTVFFLQYIFLRVSKYGLLLSSVIGSVITGTAVAFSLVKLANKIKNGTKTLFYNIMFSANTPMILIQACLFLYLTTLSSAILYYALPAIAISLAAMTILFYAGRKNLNGFVKTKTSPFPLVSILEFAAIFFVIFTVSRIVTIVAPQYLALTFFASALANVAGSAFSLGFAFIHGTISAQYAGFLLGLIISAGLLSKTFVGLISPSKDLKTRLITYSLLIGIATFLAAAIPYYGI